MIKIDIVSDVVCPWCLIGYKRLQQALKELDIEDQVQLEWQPFELNPFLDVVGQNLQEHLSEKYGSTSEDIKNNQARLTQFGAEHGFTFDFFEEMKIVNTRAAHVLINYAKQHGLQTEMNLRLITAFYSERKDISNRDILKQEIEAVGLDSQQALALLNDKQNLNAIESKEQQWQGLGVKSVPTYVFNMKSAANGAQPVEVFKEILTELMKA